jgi:mRNA interferase MazF
LAGKLKRGDVHICRFAPPDKQRPVLILTRDTSIGHLATVTVAPITSTVRDVPSEVILDVDEPVRGQSPQCGHRVTAASHQTRSQPEPGTDAGGLLSPAVLARL